MKQYIKRLFFDLFIYLFKKDKLSEKINSIFKSKVLVIIFDDLENSLSLTPFIKVLNSSLNCEITILGNKLNKDIFQNISCVNNFIVFEDNIISTSIKLSRYKFGVVINPNEEENETISFLSGLINAKYKIGFEKKDINLYTHHFPILDHNRIHIVDRIFSLLDSFDKHIEKSDINIFYQPSKESENAIEEYFIKHDLLHHFRIAINISDSNEIGFWGINNYKNIIKFLKNYNAKVIICASIDDIEIAEKISEGKHLIFYNTDFDEYAALLKNVNIIFSPDSYVVQLAAAFKIPVFCLFVQHKTAEMINVPYNSDFDFALTDKANLNNLSYGNVLNSFIPYIEYVYEKYNNNLN